MGLADLSPFSIFIHIRTAVTSTPSLFIQSANIFSISACAHTFLLSIFLLFSTSSAPLFLFFERGYFSIAHPMARYTDELLDENIHGGSAFPFSWLRVEQSLIVTNVTIANPISLRTHKIYIKLYGRFSSEAILFRWN